MMIVAYKMLVGDRAKYIGIIMGLTFAALLMTQQASIFVGLMSRTFNFIADTGQPDIWVMDEKVQYIDDVKPMQDTQLLRVRGVEGVEWAVPLYKGLLKARLADGTFQTCNIVGLDDTTLLGGPPVMLEGKLEDLRRADGVIVDQDGARGKLAKVDPVTGEMIRALQVGDSLEVNDRRAIVVGICKVSPTFGSQPTVYTTYSRAISFAPRERKQLSFVLVKARAGEEVEQVAARIEATIGLKALPAADFKWETVMYYVENTGIAINFGITVVLGFIVGTAIAGQTFYNFTQDNLKQFGTLKAMGATNFMLLRMIVLQAVVVGLLGYGLGVGVAALFGNSPIVVSGDFAFRLLQENLLISAAAMVLICTGSALISIIKVIRLEPAIVFKG